MNRTLSEWITFLLQSEASDALVLHRGDVQALRVALEDVDKRLDAPTPEPEDVKCHNCLDPMGPDDLQVCRGCYRELESAIEAVKDAVSGY